MPQNNENKGDVTCPDCRYSSAGCCLTHFNKPSPNQPEKFNRDGKVEPVVLYSSENQGKLNQEVAQSEEWIETAISELQNDLFTTASNNTSANFNDRLNDQRKVIKKHLTALLTTERKKIADVMESMIDSLIEHAESPVDEQSHAAKLRAMIERSFVERFKSRISKL